MMLCYVKVNVCDEKSVKMFLLRNVKCWISNRELYILVDCRYNSETRNKTISIPTDKHCEVSLFSQN